jgi:hypothetical protein
MPKLTRFPTECEDFRGVAGQDDFIQHIRVTRDDVLMEMSDMFTQLREQAFVDIRHATEIDTSDSYVADSMRETYERCLEITATNAQAQTGKQKKFKATTVHAQRVELVQQKLTGTGNEASVYGDVAKFAMGEMEEKLNAWQEEGFKKALNDACNSIIDDFGRRFDDAEESKPKMEDLPDLKEKLLAAADHALQQTKGPLKDLVDTWAACEN